LSDNKTEREVELKQAGLSFLIVNLGVPWALRPNSKVLSRSCPKRVLFFFFRRGTATTVTTDNGKIRLMLCEEQQVNLWQCFRKFEKSLIVWGCECDQAAWVKN